MPWQLNGNASTTNDEFLGTTDNHPVAIRTNNHEALRVDTAGNVGIGSSAPQNRLHVGPGSSSIAAGRVNAVIASNSVDAGIAIAQNSGVNVLLQGSGAGGYIGTTSNHPLVLRTNDLDRVVIDANTGNVGIGTSDPGSSKLSVISDDDIGVFGETTSASTAVAGVVGNNAGTGTGVGVLGKGYTGIRGEGTEAGVEGYYTGSSTAWGVLGDGGENGVGVAGSGDKGPGISGTSVSGPAGFFGGPVSIIGDVNIIGTIYNVSLADIIKKIINQLEDCCGGGGGGGNFLIDHPLEPANRLLAHSAVKSPELKNIYDGVATLDTNGEAIVQLPAWFTALSSDFRYQLTAVGVPAPNLHIGQQITNNSFKISGGVRGMTVCWQITGVRQDRWAQAKPLVVEQNKAANEVGYYVHPQVHGEPTDKDIRWIRETTWMQQLRDVQNLPEEMRTHIEQQRNPELEQRLKQRPGSRG
jgi:hypothetical protein